MIIIIKKNAIMVLIGVELILNASIINMIGFSQFDPSINGQLFALFIIVVTVAESAVALAIIYQVYKHTGFSDIDELNKLHG